jgi:hypothetical protein
VLHIIRRGIDEVHCIRTDGAADRLKSLTELGRRQGTMEGWIFFRSAGGRFWPIAAFCGNAANGHFWGVSSTGRRNTTRWGTPAVALEQFLH